MLFLQGAIGPWNRVYAELGWCGIFLGSSKLKSGPARLEEALIVRTLGVLVLHGPWAEASLPRAGKAKGKSRAKRGA